MEGGFIVLIMIFVVGGIGYSIWQKQQLNETWKALAEDHDFSFRPGGFLGHPWMGGIYEDVGVQVDVEVRGSGKNKQYFTRVRADVSAPLPNGLSLSHEGFFSMFGKMLGGQDIVIGISDIDDGLIIRGDSEYAVIRWFEHAAARDAARTLIAAGSGASVEGRTVCYTRRGLLMGLDVTTMLDTVVEVVSQLDEASGGAKQSASAPAPQPAPSPPPALPVASSSLDPRLTEIGDAFSSRDRREELIAALADEDLLFDAQVSEVQLAIDSEVPADLAGGRTALARAGTVSLCLLYAPSWNDYLDELGPQGMVPVMGRVVGWDAQTQRVLMEVR